MSSNGTKINIKLQEIGTNYLVDLTGLDRNKIKPEEITERKLYRDKELIEKIGPDSRINGSEIYRVVHIGQE